MEVGRWLHWEPGPFLGPACLPHVCFADLQYVDHLGELAGAPGWLAANPTQDVPALELGVHALAG